MAALERAIDIGIAAACAEGVGVMDKLVALTVEYMNTRKQFGTTLATFQALRHRIADVKMQLELGRSMSYFASLKLGEPAPRRRRALSQAKVQLGNSMRFVGQQCTQLHGGIGVTDEYIGSHYFKRLTMLEMSFGDTMHHLGEVSAPHDRLDRRICLSAAAAPCSPSRRTACATRPGRRPGTTRATSSAPTTRRGRWRSGSATRSSAPTVRPQDALGELWAIVLRRRAQHHVAVK